ncbi:MAG TPA: isochorismatase family cysteine hydrolase [Pyrinomonadaceae bacterium]|nr:isochorismatase family cysteine hydrolase [Pyrinomonadaceae bacterium]
MKLALMIIDMQKEYYVGKTIAQMDRATEYINAVIPLFEAKNLPIIWVQDIAEDDGVVPGTEGFELIGDLTPPDNAIIVHKRYGNSFNKTECDKILKEHGIDTVVMTGFCAEYCVLSTYRGAKDLDYFPILLKNGIASVEESNKEFVENISDTITYGVLKKMLDSN